MDNYKTVIRMKLDELFREYNSLCVGDSVVTNDDLGYILDKINTLEVLVLHVMEDNEMWE